MRKDTLSFFFFLDVIEEIPNNDCEDEFSDENDHGGNHHSSRGSGRPAAVVSAGSLMLLEGSSVAGTNIMSPSWASPLMRRAKQRSACLVEDDDDDDDDCDDSPKELVRDVRRTLSSSLQQFQSRVNHPNGIQRLLAATEKRDNIDDDWGFYEEHEEHDD